MPEDKQLGFDAEDSDGDVKDALLRDIEEATRLAKQRKASDRARDAQLRAKPGNRALLYAITIVAALILFVIAYKVVFRAEPGPGTSTGSGSFVPMRGAAPAPGYQPRMPNTYRPQPPAPPSEPVRRNPRETYEEYEPEGM